MTKSNNSKFIIKLSFILFSIVFIATLLLTVCNYCTVDKIAEIEAQSADNARRNVIANAEFEEIDISSFDADLQDAIIKNKFNSAHKASIDGNFAGYCISVSPQGFGGPVNMIVGVSPDMNVTGVEIISMSETPGLGAKAQDEEFIGQFFENKKGKLELIKNQKNASENQINAISGATITSKAVMNGANNALDIAEILMKEAE